MVCRAISWRHSHGNSRTTTADDVKPFEGWHERDSITIAWIAYPLAPEPLVRVSPHSLGVASFSNGVRGESKRQFAQASFEVGAFVALIARQNDVNANCCLGSLASEQTAGGPSSNHDGHRPLHEPREQNRRSAPYVFTLSLKALPAMNLTVVEAAI
jgi:hypothetical protein